MTRKNSKLLLMILLIALTVSCKTVPIKPTVFIPDFTMQKPIRPVMEPVVLVDPVPASLLRNYSAVTTYAMSWEDYDWEYEKFLAEQREIYNK
jgi:hypothetical protein